MKSYSIKTIALAYTALVALLMLSACSFSLPKIGGIKGTDTATPEAAATATEGTEEESFSATV